MAMTTKTYKLHTRGASVAGRDAAKEWVQAWTFTGIGFTDEPNGDITFSWDAWKPGHDAMGERVACVNTGLMFGRL